MKSNLVVLGFLMVALSACNSDPEPEAAATTSSTQPQKATDPTSRMARAVGGGKPGAAVEIKYDFLAKPEVGKPVDVDLALIPNTGVSTLDVEITGMDGVTLTGPLHPTFNDVKAGQAYKHQFSLLAERNGVFYLTVAATTHIGTATMGRTFSIPFVVGQAPAKEKPTAPQQDANGQPIQPMAAQETTAPK